MLGKQLLKLSRIRGTCGIGANTTFWRSEVERVDCIHSLKIFWFRGLIMAYNRWCSMRDGVRVNTSSFHLLWLQHIFLGYSSDLIPTLLIYCGPVSSSALCLHCTTCHACRRCVNLHRQNRKACSTMYEAHIKNHAGWCGTFKTNEEASVESRVRSFTCLKRSFFSDEMQITVLPHDAECIIFSGRSTFEAQITKRYVERVTKWKWTEVKSKLRDLISNRE